MAILLGIGHLSKLLVVLNLLANVFVLLVDHVDV